jgi:hypothetical protein
MLDRCDLERRKGSRRPVTRRHECVALHTDGAGTADSSYASGVCCGARDERRLVRALCPAKRSHDPLRPSAFGARSRAGKLGGGVCGEGPYVIALANKRSSSVAAPLVAGVHEQRVR